MFDVDEIQYDDEGNVIIPDDTDDEGADDVTDTDDGGENNAEGENKTPVQVDKGEVKPENEPESEVKTEEKGEEKHDDKIADLEKQIAELKEKNEKQAKEGLAVLKKLGFDGESYDDALIKAAAETEELSVEEYIEKRKKEADEAQGQELLKKSQFEQLKAKDLAVLKSVFPDVEDVKNLDDLEKMDNFKRFAELRDLGASVEEAFRAANPRAIERKVIETTKQSNLNSTKDHLKSNVPKGTKDTSVHMTKEEYALFKDAFPNKTDAEILALYKQTKD